ncbi:MAG: hypothetical protein QM726_09115 [Chitinophagaceae bacterium]
MSTPLKFMLAVLFGAIVFAACKKTNNTNANVLFYNGTWSLTAISALWNNTSVINPALAQGQSTRNADSPYLQLQAGTNLVNIKTGSTSFLEKNIYASASNGTSFIFFDTSATGGKANILQLTDDLTLPDTFHINYRVLYLQPDTSVKVDVWLVNGITDSVRLDTARTFIGATAEASSLQTFSTLSYHASSYTVKVKQTGTENLYASINSYPFVIKGIYSIIFSGLHAGTDSASFKLSVLHHRT